MPDVRQDLFDFAQRQATLRKRPRERRPSCDVLRLQRRLQEHVGLGEPFEAEARNFSVVVEETNRLKSWFILDLS